MIKKLSKKDLTKYIGLPEGRRTWKEPSENEIILMNKINEIIDCLPTAELEGIQRPNIDLSATKIEIKDVKHD